MVCFVGIRRIFGLGFCPDFELHARQYGAVVFADLLQHQLIRCVFIINRPFGLAVTQRNLLALPGKDISGRSCSFFHGITSEFQRFCRSGSVVYRYRIDHGPRFHQHFATGGRDIVLGNHLEGCPGNRRPVFRIGFPDGNSTFLSCIGRIIFQGDRTFLGNREFLFPAARITRWVFRLNYFEPSLVCAVAFQSCFPVFTLISQPGHISNIFPAASGPFITRESRSCQCLPCFRICLGHNNVCFRAKPHNRFGRIAKFRGDPCGIGGFIHVRMIRPLIVPV